MGPKGSMTHGLGGCVSRSEPGEKEAPDVEREELRPRAGTRPQDS